MYIKYKYARILFTLVFLHITNAQQKQIILKPMMQVIPTIDSKYNVVHSDIYPKANEEKFKPTVAADFYVEKALKNKDKAKIQIVNTEQQYIRKPEIQKKTQQDLSKKPQIESVALSENNKQKINWAITPPNPLSSFVIDNGVQHTISQAIPLQQQTKPAGMVSQDIPIDHLTPIDPAETMSKPQNQLKSQKTTTPATDSRQQRKSLANNQPPTTQARAEQKSNNITLLIVGAIVLICVFIFVRSQRKKKVSSLSILHSRLESYKFQHEDEDLDSFSKSRTSLQQEEESDDQNQGESTQIYKYNDNRV